ncbi:hypothetical protein GCM10020000_31090 [Streptomyces olivoverticillatus]
MSDIFSGAAHAFNSAGEWGEKKLQQGKKKLGQAVHAGTEAVGDVLDAAGAHGAADTVEDWGDGAASALGAHVGERQLGESEEAEELVHGNVKKINATAKHLRSFHTAFDGIHGNLQRIRATDWKGEGADAFTTKFVEHPQQWAHAADACEAAAGALEAYAHTVEWAQGQAKEAVRLYKKAKEAEKKAVDAYNAKVVVYNLTLEKGKDPGPKPDKPGKVGEADVHEARRILTEARKQRDTAAGEARSKVAAAVAHAPAKPSFSDRMKGDALDLADGGSLELLHAAGGGIRAATDMEKMARSMNPADPYNMTHPADYLGGLNNSVAGMLSLASHPERAPAALLGTGWGSDPSEAAGKLAGTVLLAVATGGGSTAAASAAERTAAREGGGGGGGTGGCRGGEGGGFRGEGGGEAAGREEPGERLASRTGRSAPTAPTLSTWPPATCSCPRPTPICPRRCRWPSPAGPSPAMRRAAGSALRGRARRTSGSKSTPRAWCSSARTAGC